MTIFILILTTSYAILMLALLLGWMKIPEFEVSNLAPVTQFSIIVPYRNEAENLPLLLQSFLALDYPLSSFEILLINDASEDESETICFEFLKENPKYHIYLLDNVRVSNSPKKDAITLGVDNALFDQIITTDADCQVPKRWLQAFNESLIETDAKLIAGPVSPLYPSPDQHLQIPEKAKKFGNWETFREHRSKPYFYAFQEMDFLSLQLAGAGGFGIGNGFMCNGANLCYNRAAFYEVNGYTGNKDISSGDDVFLLQKFVEHKFVTTFLKCKEAIISTKPQPDLTALFAQRIRWAAKTPAYNSAFAKFTGLTVLLMNLLIVTGFMLVFFQLIPYLPILIAFMFKFSIDLLLLYSSAGFFGRKEILRNYFWSSLAYPFFTTAVACMSLFKKVEWKGRVTRR